MTDRDLLSHAQDLADRLDSSPIEGFVTWTASRSEANAVVLGYPVYSALETEWRDLVQALGCDQGAAAYGSILNGEAARPTQELIAKADIDSLRAYALFIIRGERFSDGHIAKAHSEGQLSAVLRRFIALGETP